MRFHLPELIDNPYPYYKQWLEELPIWRDEETNHWVLTRNEDIRAILKNSSVYSSAAMAMTESPLPLISDDPPRHTQLRGLVDKAFTVRRLRVIEEVVDEIAKQQVAKIVPGEPVDIVSALTIPLPVAVIAMLMDIPRQRTEDFKRWSNALTGALAGADMAEREAEIMEMGAFFAALIPERRKNPGDDLISAVVNAELDDGRLNDQEIVGFCILLLIAGNETTTNLLGNFLNLMADRPEIYSELSVSTKMIEKGIDEALRYDSPVQYLMRTATADMELHGQKVAAGDVVQVVMGAANHDPRSYEDPDTYKLGRQRLSHHSFGFGIHFCIGAPLARLEAKVAMQALVGRFKTFNRAAGQDQRTPSHLLRGFNHLWLEFNE
ncbi:MAG: cytochrome P450 [Pseudomonadales bacterium]|nr:cytochrome P450 [Pseudomonadales bacterium]